MTEEQFTALLAGVYMMCISGTSYNNADYATTKAENVLATLRNSQVHLPLEFYEKPISGRPIPGGLE